MALQVQDFLNRIHKAKMKSMEMICQTFFLSKKLVVFKTRQRTIADFCSNFDYTQRDIINVYDIETCVKIGFYMQQKKITLCSASKRQDFF